MIRMFARRMAEKNVVSGTDEVLIALSLPSGSRINDINMEFSLHQSAVLGIDSAVMYAIEGWILPVLDPDAASTMEVLWDTLVPKDTDVETVDLDTGASDTTPFFEPGEPDFTGLLEVGLKPERIYTASRILTMANGGSVFSFQDNQTPFAVNWVAGSKHRIRIRKNFAVSQPSVLVFAVGNPTLDDTTATEPTALAEAQWPQVKYIGNVLERAMLHLFGLVEAGAETPWEEATALLKLHLEPDVFEENAGFWQSASWRVFARGIIDHSVVGEMEKITVSTG